MYNKLHPFQVYSSISFDGHCERTTIKSAKHFYHPQKTLHAPLQSRSLSTPPTLTPGNLGSVMWWRNAQYLIQNASFDLFFEQLTNFSLI